MKETDQDQKMDSVVRLCYNHETKMLDIAKLANILNFRIIEREDFPLHVESIIQITEEGRKKEILINKGKSIERKRYLIMQELSYFFLYCYDETKGFKHVTNNKNLFENQNVEHLVRNTLLPEEVFEDKYFEIKNKYSKETIITKLSKEFYVPKELVENRINDIKNKKLTIKRLIRIRTKK